MTPEPCIYGPAQCTHATCVFCDGCLGGHYQEDLFHLDCLNEAEEKRLNEPVSNEVKCSD
jgi:hypothetical protein